MSGAAGSGGDAVDGFFWQDVAPCSVECRPPVCSHVQKPEVMLHKETLHCSSFTFWSLRQLCWAVCPRGSWPRERRGSTSFIGGTRLNFDLLTQ